MNHQGLIFKGIYEFDDPSGTILASRLPQSGSLDFFKGTAVNVRPNQKAIFIFKGKMADSFGPGLYELSDGTLPILSRLAGYAFGFTSKFRGEIWFFSTQSFLSRRWGTAKPVLHQFEEFGSAAVRAFGTYSVKIVDTSAFLTKLIGSRASYDITEFEDFVQNQILELLPQALKVVQKIENLGQKQDEVSKRLEDLVNAVTKVYGIEVYQFQVSSLLPSDEILKALDSKRAMEVIGDQRKYLLYKAANSLEIAQGNRSGDPMQMMLGMMLGKSLMSLETGSHSESSPVLASPASAKGLPEKAGASSLSANEASQKYCTDCGTAHPPSARFCSQCGGKYE